MNPTPEAIIAPDIGVGNQLGVPGQQEVLWCGHLPQFGHRAHHLGDLSGAALVGPVEHRHTAVAGNRRPGFGSA